MFSPTPVLSFVAKFGRMLCMSLLSFTLAGGVGHAQVTRVVALGDLPDGGSVRFEQQNSLGWRILVDRPAAPNLESATPVRLEQFREGSVEPAVTRLPYGSVTATGEEVVAEATVRADGAEFQVRDTWRLEGNVATVRRAVAVTRGGRGGFSSAVEFAIAPEVDWAEVQCFAPGALYGDPTYDGERSPGGTLNYAHRRFLMREDLLPAPVFGVSFAGGGSVAVLDPDPAGDSTWDETRLAEAVMIDERFRFGALGAWQPEGAPVELGFRYPGSVARYPRSNGDAAPEPIWYRRYHPIEPEVEHAYTVAFRFGEEQGFPAMTRAAWRWAWSTLQPEVEAIDVVQMQRVLIDHLAAQAATIDGRTGMPFVKSTLNDKLQWNWTMVAMGFVGKNLECADLLLREAEADPTERGARMREIGFGIIHSLIEALPTVPLEATGYDLATGQPWDHHWLAPWLRNASEDMCVLMHTYRREKDLGRDHPEWFAWVKAYTDWLVEQQRPDGSFPRRWERGSSEVAEPTGTTSYAPVPLLVAMSAETGDARYREAGARAADYVWQNWGRHGLYIGGASDNPNITDKEAGMLSMEAFLGLHEATGEAQWLERARMAADFTETWMWIWNLPMPVDATDEQLNYKRGVSTIGPQGISALYAGSVDEYLDWAVPSYAKLYRLTGDTHYRDVAAILLHATKSMVAIPGRQYDLKGIGWQQEGWRFGPGGSGRGGSGHRFWLPWISANHLHGIMELQASDPQLYAELTSGGTRVP